MANSVVVQWNSRSINNKKSDLYHIINKLSPFAVSLQETWLKPEFNFKISGYSCLREDRSDSYGGVAILIKHSIPFTHIPIPSHSTDFSIIAADINNICFVSIYIPHPNTSVYNEIDQIFTSLPKPILIMGDFNAQHQSWGSSSSNYYGNRILEIIDHNNFCILNNGQPTRRTAPNEGTSAPDLTICTPSLTSSLNWSTLNSTYGSDHFPVIVTFPYVIDKKSFNNRQPRLKYKLEKVNWNLYRDEVHKKISLLPPLIECNVLACTDKFTRILTDTANEMFPVKKGKPRKFPTPPWWDDECSEAIKNRKLAERSYKDFSSVENFNSLSDIIGSTRKLFKQKKWEGWKKFCAGVSPEVSPSIVWCNIRKYRSAYSASKPTFIHSSIANQFLDKIAPPFVPQQYFPQLAISTNSEINVELSAPFNLNEIKAVLSYVKDSSPGTDGIPYSFITHLSDSSLTYFLNIINSVMFSGHIPPSWKSQEVIPILKPNSSPSKASSYRPIALSSVLTKITEHLIKNRLEWFVENKSLLGNNQYGFRKGKSTMDSIGIFTTDIRLAFTFNKSLIAAFLDISAAYDNANLYILRQKLQDLKIPAILCNFIINILIERSVILVLEDSAVLKRTTWKGLPQGSVLSPILYNIYTYDLDRCIKTDNVNVLQYADDLLIYISGISVENIANTLTSSLKFIKLWLDDNNLSLSVLKSSIVLFSRMRFPPPVTVLYDNMSIPVVKETKFLGIILDSKLSGLPHCYYIASKCERILNILRCLAGVWWGAHPCSLKLLFDALVRSILDYGTYFLEPCSAVGLKKLDLIQSKALRIISGAMKSSPINALQVECGEPPLKFRRQLLCDRFLFRALQFSDHPIYLKLKLLSDNIERSSYWLHKSIPCIIVSFRKFLSLQAPTHRSHVLPIFCSTYDALILNPIVNFNLDVLKNDPNANNNLNYLLNTDWNDWHHIYSDASKLTNTGCVGVGIYHHQYKIVEKIKLPPESSVFTGECFGLLKSLEYIRLMKLQKTIIFSDSKSALQALDKYPFKTNSKMTVILECRELLLKCLSIGLKVSFAWLPSHHNISGNDRADILAKDAIVCGDIFPYKNYCADLIAMSKADLRKSWEASWYDSSRFKGRSYAAIQPHIPIKPWFSVMRLGKMATSSIIRMRLGHTCTPAHLARFNIINDQCCDCGDECGDLNHLFFSCPLYDRSSFISSLISLRVPFPSSINVLLSLSNIDIYKVISVYLSQNNIKI
jgi:ribonuclease HI